METGGPYLGEDKYVGPTKPFGVLSGANRNGPRGLSAVSNVPLADSPQQAVSPDMPQQDVSPNMPQHHPLPQRICRPNPRYFGPSFVNTTIFQMENAKAIFTPMSSFDKLPPPEPCTTIDISRYRRLLALNNVDVVLHRLRPYLTKINRNRDDEDVPYPASFADTTHLLQFFKVLDADTPSSAELRVQRVECNFYYVSPEVYLNPSKPRTYPKRVYL
ncbi:hypothetical protein V6N11_007610 [Hibiscus sabdariffa]|uniref:Uncharacterized protein n=1 Tax=Hibiscus sabdariffa TaxID=183260 RepID=A0ABR2NIV5_9ROSI